MNTKNSKRSERMAAVVGHNLLHYDINIVVLSERDLQKQVALQKLGTRFIGVTRERINHMKVLWAQPLLARWKHFSRKSATGLN
jgi:hypothetical protein